MKVYLKIIFSLVFLFLFLSPLLAQSDTTNIQLQNKGADDEFNLFLFAIAFLFICAMMGAAIIGSLIALLIMGFIFLLITIGVLSSSIFIALYKKSISAGFKSLLVFVFSISCAAISVSGIAIVNAVFNLHYSSTTVLLIGLTSGLCSGLCISMATYNLIIISIKKVAVKLQHLP